MRTPLAACLALVAAVGLVLPAPSAAVPAAPSLAGETTLAGEGPGWTEVVVPSDLAISEDAFTVAAAETVTAGFALVPVEEDSRYLVGLRFPEGLQVAGEPGQQLFSPAGGSVLTAGRYRFYLLTPVGTSATVGLRLPLPGEIELSPQQASSFEARTMRLPGGPSGEMSHDGAIDGRGLVVAALAVVGAGPRATRANACIYLHGALPPQLLVATPDCVPPVTGGGLHSASGHSTAPDGGVVADRLVVAGPTSAGRHTVAVSTGTAGTLEPIAHALMAWVSFN